MASRVITRAYDRALAPVGLRTNDYSILVRLDQEGELPLGALAARLAMDRSTLSRETAPLIAAGLLRAEPDPSDGRRRLLTLTDEGCAALERARPLWAEAQDALGARFGRARTAGLVAELQALVGAGP